MAGLCSGDPTLHGDQHQIFGQFANKMLQFLLVTCPARCGLGMHFPTRTSLVRGCGLGMRLSVFCLPTSAVMCISKVAATGAIACRMVNTLS